MVEGLVSEGAETIVIVGNDQSLRKVMWFLPDLPVTVGYIPVGEPASIGAMLGISIGEAACDVLAARRIESLDMGTIDDRYFLTEVMIPATKAAVDIHGQYRIAPREVGDVFIRNLGSMGEDGHSTADARDGLLEVLIRPIIQEPIKRRLAFLSSRSQAAHPETRLTLSRGSIISNEPVDIDIDGHRINGFTFRLGIVPKKLRIITGRDKKLDPQPAPFMTTMLPTPLPAQGTVSDLSKRAKNVTFPRTTADTHGWRNWYTR